MAKLKTFEEYIADIDSAEEIEKDIMTMGEPGEAEGGEDYVSDDQPKAKAPAKSEDEGAGEDAEEMEADTKEVHSEEDKKTEEGDQEMPEDEGEEGAKEVEESLNEEDEDDDEVQDEAPEEDDQVEADDGEESDDEGEDESEDEDDEDEDESDDEDEESEEEPKLVTDILKEAFEAIKNEAKIWEEDMHDTHTVETYLNENAALVASMGANALTEMKKDITLEQYEAACNGLKESYSKKIEEMIEAFEAEGEMIEVED